VPNSSLKVLTSGLACNGLGPSLKSTNSLILTCSLERVMNEIDGLKLRSYADGDSDCFCKELGARTVDGSVIV